MSGLVKVHFRVGHQSVRTQFGEYDSVPIKLEVFRLDYMREKNTMIFLSYKGVDKPMVQRFNDALELLGFSPWLDDEMMPAGAKLHRAIQEGFEDSCQPCSLLRQVFETKASLPRKLTMRFKKKRKKEKGFQ